MRILVIDGQGGKLGRRLVEILKNSFPEAEITAVGTNAWATGAMLRGGADHAATGENAVIAACRQAEIIIGPIGIVMADAVRGEISPAMAQAIASSRAYKILIPMNLCGAFVAGVCRNSNEILQDAADKVHRLMTGEEAVQ
ncbi:MAG: DUF3842 family protein [Butyricicoccaceae bacterium]